MHFKNIEIKGYFSSIHGSSIQFDSSNLQYLLKNNSTPIDLNIGSRLLKKTYEESSKENPPLHMMMEWIKRNYRTIEANPTDEKWLKPNFILHHTLLIKLLRSLYGEGLQWVIYAVKWRGSIYLYESASERALPRCKDKSLYLRNDAMWPIRLSKNITSDTLNGLANIYKIVDHNEKFHCIFQSQLGDHLLLYSNVMGAVCSHKILKDPLPLDELKFIEIKVYRNLANDRGRDYFTSNRTLDWWSLCTAIGIEKVLCGVPDSAGIVENFQTFSMADLINIGKSYWNPSASINYCNDFLTHVAKVVVNDYDKTIYKFERRPYVQDIEMTEISPKEYDNVPQWFDENTL